MTKSAFAPFDPTLDYTPHEEIRLLFEEVIAKFKKEGNLKFRDRQIFAEVLGDNPEMLEAFARFLHDVSTCPPEVIRWCQRQVNPTARLRAVK